MGNNYLHNLRTIAKGPGMMGKSSFVLFAQIRALLDLKHFQIRLNPEAVACRDQQ
jgi:hypothetical protein